MTAPLLEGDILAHNVHDGFILCTTSQNAAGEVRIAVVKVAKANDTAVYSLTRIMGKDIGPMSVQLLEDVGWAYAGRAVPSYRMECACNRGPAYVLANGQQSGYDAAEMEAE